MSFDSHGLMYILNVSHVYRLTYAVSIKVHFFLLHLVFFFTFRLSTNIFFKKNDRYVAFSHLISLQNDRYS